MESFYSRSHASRLADASIAGPGLSAIRAACKPYGEKLAGLMPTFERIGQHIDTAVSQPGFDGLFSTNRERIIVVVSDVLWGDRVLLTEVRAGEIARALTAQKLGIAEACAHTPSLTDKHILEAVCLGWVSWSRHARRIFRRPRGASVWNGTATAAVGGLLFIHPSARRKLAEIAISGETPLIAVALNSTGATRKRLKCNVRAVVFRLPGWARASGTVAGCA